MEAQDRTPEDLLSAAEGGFSQADILRFVPDVASGARGDAAETFERGAGKFILEHLLLLGMTEEEIDAVVGRLTVDNLNSLVPDAMTAIKDRMHTLSPGSLDALSDQVWRTEHEYGITNND
jgi:hypothetical protein